MRSNVTSHKCVIFNKTDGLIKHLLDNDTHQALNNKCEFHSVTNKILHHVNGNLYATDQKAISKSVMLCFGKDTLEQKNKKNMLLNHNQNKVNVNRFNDFEKTQNYEKHLNGINQLIEERFIIKDDVEHCDSYKSIKLQSTPGVESVALPTVTPSEPLLQTNGHVVNGEASNSVEVIPFNCNVHKLNGQAKSHEKAQSNIRNEYTTDLSTIKINYVPRQIRPTNGCVSSKGLTTNENHSHAISLHDNPKNVTNRKSIPNIRINGSLTDLSDRTINGVVETGLMGEFSDFQVKSFI